MVNYTLEYRKGIGKAKGHNLILVISIASLKGGLIFVSFLNPNIVKSYGEIE